MQLVVKFPKISCMFYLKVFYILDVQLMLRHFVIVEHFFTLDTLNSRIKSFVYSRKEAKSKPPKSLLPGHITGKGKLPLSGIYIKFIMLLLCKLIL